MGGLGLVAAAFQQFENWPSRKGCLRPMGRISTASPLPWMLLPLPCCRRRMQTCGGRWGRAGRSSWSAQLRRRGSSWRMCGRHTRVRGWGGKQHARGQEGPPPHSLQIATTTPPLTACVPFCPAPYMHRVQSWSSTLSCWTSRQSSWRSSCCSPSAAAGRARSSSSPPASSRRRTDRDAPATAALVWS